MEKMDRGTEESSSGDDQFRAALERIFRQLPLLPEEVVAEVHSADYAEDGKTFVLMLHTADGRTMIVTAEPGKPIGISVQ